MHGVGLVRGINVGGAGLVGMADLAAAFEGAGFRAVKTLVQRGNVVFDASTVVGEADAAAVERGIAARTAVSARVILLSEPEFRAIAAANPLRDAGDDPSRLMVTFLDHAVLAGVVTDAPADRTGSRGRAPGRMGGVPVVPARRVEVEAQADVLAVGR